MAKHDFSKALNALFNDENIVIEATIDVNLLKEELDTRSKNVEVLLRELRTAMSRKVGEFDSELQNLHNQMSLKMQEFTATSGADSDTIAELQKTVDDLKQSYEQKKNEVDEVLHKVDSLMPELRDMPEMSSKLGMIQDKLSHMASELEAKGQEIASLSAEMNKNRASAHKLLKSNQKLIQELDDYASHVDEQLKRATVEIKRLEELVSGHQRVNVPKASLESAGNSFGTFGNWDLSEYLTNAKRIQDENAPKKSDKPTVWNGVL